MTIVTGAGMQLRGPPGDAGPSGVPYINFAYPNTVSYGGMGTFNARRIATGSIAPFDINGGTAMPLLIRPLRDMSLSGFNFTNTSASAGGMAISLRNYANDQAVFTSATTAANSNSVQGPFNVGQFALTAGTTYYWSAGVTATGNYSAWVVPQYYQPSGAAAFTSTYPTFQLSPSLGGLLGLTPSTLSTTAAFMGPVGFVNGTTFAFAAQTLSHVSNVQFVNQGSGTASFFLQNTVSGTVVYTGPVLAANTMQSTGSLPPSAIPLTAGTKYAWYITGSGSMAQNLTMQICQ